MWNCGLQRPGGVEGKEDRESLINGNKFTIWRNYVVVSCTIVGQLELTITYHILKKKQL